MHCSLECELTITRLCHVITGDRQRDQQYEGGGGILADEMGMGKSLITLVLVVKTAKDAREWEARSRISPSIHLVEKPCRATLVVVHQQCESIPWYCMALD